MASQLHQQLNDGRIDLSKNNLRVMSSIESRVTKICLSETYILTNLDPFISWRLPRWKIRHQISQDLIDAVRKTVSRVPPSSGGKRPKNNAAQEPNHMCETTFRHETCPSRHLTTSPGSAKTWAQPPPCVRNRE